MLAQRGIYHGDGNVMLLRLKIGRARKEEKIGRKERRRWQREGERLGFFERGKERLRLAL